MNCDTCALWTTVRKTIYDDSEVVNYQAPDGKGYCSILEIETRANFGCNEHQEGTEHVVTSRKGGAAWSHWVMGKCPDCKGAGNQGDSGCYRCTGTGNVRYYDDGYIGEERTRMHPKEREGAAKPKCMGCGKEVQPEWVACPACGHKLDAAVAAEKIDDPLFSA